MKIITLETKIAGIPCIVNVSVFPAYRGMRENGIPIEPDEKPYWIIDQVFDRKSYPAPWLIRKLENKSTYDKFCKDVENLLREDASC
jgi:hypothetical protein